MDKVMNRDIVNGLEVLDLDEYAMAEPFFEGFNIYESFLRSILQNRSAGKVLTDNKNDPSFVLVCTPVVISKVSSPYACAFLAGELDQNALTIVASSLKTFPKVSLVTPTEWKHRAFFEEEGFYSIERVQLRKPLDYLNVDILKQSLPSQYSISRINEDNFARCHWHAYVLSRYGDERHFFENGVGFCLEDQGKIVSESYGYIANGKAEFGVITDEKYRGQNLGTLICLPMLDYCTKNNIEPYWNCDIDNPASGAIAKKLKFQEDCTYLFLRWESP
jgi:RimJ/RimL family protein N-acetyltransferase